MDQEKIGSLLKELRKEKGLTQEELAEHFGVSNRTISRWETGSNMPDLSLLVEIADFYDVDIREIIDGERKSEKMNEEMKNTLLKAADYAEEEKGILLRRVRNVSILGIITLMFGVLIGNNASDLPVTSFLCGIMFGITWGALIVTILFTTGILEKMRKAGNKRTKILIMAVSIAVALIGFILAIVESL
ncbi:MAG: helix-turn-helix domain-containing protein [Lachnospiraceae bacterium]|nr:helix-turn-helix domain-containing protein [Lachnospiraceae bacterium]